MPLHLQMAIEMDWDVVKHNQLFKQIIPLYENIPTFCIDHHYSHILSAWPLVLYQRMLVLELQLTEQGITIFEWLSSPTLVL